MSSTVDIEECPVCFESLNYQIKTILPCKHTLCLKCLLKLKNKVCVICRKDITECFPDTDYMINEETDMPIVTLQMVTRPPVQYQTVYEDVQLESLLHWVRRSREIQDELRNMAIQRILGGIPRPLFESSDTEEVE